MIARIPSAIYTLARNCYSMLAMPHDEFYLNGGKTARFIVFSARRSQELLEQANS